MNKHDRGTIVGMVLGDGYIKVANKTDRLKGRHPSAQITFSHSIKQKEYAEYKIGRLNVIFGGNATLRVGTYKAKNGNDYTICYASKSNPYFKVLRRILYKNGKKYISKQILDMLSLDGIAMWFMDDGSYRVNKNGDGTITSLSLSLSTYCSKEENESIIEYFNSNYGIEWKLAFCKKNNLWSLRANTESSKKLANLMFPYIIDSMQYKISCVDKLKKHERLEPNNVCKVCNKKFVSLRAKGMCSLCYTREYHHVLTLRK